MIIAFCRRGDSSQTLGRRLRAKLFAAGAVLLAVSVPAQASDATRQAYHERSLILAANARCQLFKPDVEQALQAAALQTRGVLLRSGMETSVVGAIASRARSEANGLSCSDPGLQSRANRIVHAFDRWGRAARVEFPANEHSWRVDRFQRSETGWRMVQDSRVGRSPVRFGLAGPSPSQVRPMVVVSFQGQARPYAARLVMRDTRALPRAHAVENGLAAMPPFAARQMVLAAGREQAPASLLAEGQRRGDAWVFGSEIMVQLTRLDPREPFWIEFLFRDDSIARVTFEAGDAAAARTFLSLGGV
ncbi:MULTISPECIES: hypothetical protein [unclassified Brevundimonas]|uniref:hypothetical protein n=1 Tax=unclassified Brevundimonas TaxID=2622653 RepID=UPI0025C40169|nr:MULTISPECIES: hypothetical protein [unclassified Brevundimonas]